ncbi:hypothetical protein [Thermotoga sp. SG1]|uniref:hypothetical protein n=1 Tax=Thermotoga sp. SG1 TaxID=126739 RepID=UPI001E4C3A9F|nr:hypothetical protein [Thermotoga sp. SG1]
MFGLALSLIFSILSWKESFLLSILVLVISLFFLSDKREKNRNIFYVSLVFLLILEVFEYLKGVSYDLAETYLVVSFIFLVVSDFMKKRVENLIFMAIFWFFVSLSLWRVASVRYPGASYLVFPAVALIFLRDVFRRERDGRKIRIVSDEGAVDGGGEVQKVAGSGTGGDESLRRTGNDSERSDGKGKK